MAGLSNWALSSVLSDSLFFKIVNDRFLIKVYNVTYRVLRNSVIFRMVFSGRVLFRAANETVLSKVLVGSSLGFPAMGSYLGS